MKKARGKKKKAKVRDKTGSAKLWGGGYAARTSAVVEKFTESVSFDKRLAPFDIRGSIAHAEMLGKQKIIPLPDAQKIVKGLKDILQEIEDGEFSWNESLEDVHMNIESALTRKIGDAGARVHTARSRNDQVATAFKLYCADAAEKALKRVEGLVHALARVISIYGEKIMPGYTHLQQAQPVRFRTHFGAYREMFVRDMKRFLAARLEALFICPLGSGALAGSTLPIDRAFTARKLGFAHPSRNPMDSVADRDFALELLFAASLFQVHLSRLAEDLIIFSSKEFGFIQLADSVTTGSSLMPQKKNPDVCELTRGKTGRVVGNLVALLTTMKGLPMTYNRDMQEDKEPVFDSIDTILAASEAMALAVETMQFNSERAEKAIDPSMLATDLAEHLVEQGVPFRHAHEIVARLVHSGADLAASDDESLAKVHPSLKNSRSRLDPHEAARRRKL